MASTEGNVMATGQGEGQTNLGRQTTKRDRTGPIKKKLGRRLSILFSLSSPTCRRKARMQRKRVTYTRITDIYPASRYSIICIC